MTIYFIEIKNRLILTVFSAICVFFVSYFYKNILLFTLLKSLVGSNLKFKLFYFIFTDVTEIFTSYLQVMYFIIIQIVLIFMTYQIFIFLSLALFKQEYLFLSKFLKTCLFIWVLSLFTASFVLIPLSWEFFFCFQNVLSSKLIAVYFEPRISEYLNFCILFYFTTMFYFQILGVVIFITTYFINNIKITKKYKKLYYYNFIIFSTLVTPPDVFSQIFVGLFLIVCYELFSILFILKAFLTRKIVKTN